MCRLLILKTQNFAESWGKHQWFVPWPLALFQEKPAGVLLRYYRTFPWWAPVSIHLEKRRDFHSWLAWEVFLPCGIQESRSSTLSMPLREAQIKDTRAPAASYTPLQCHTWVLLLFFHVLAEIFTVDLCFRVHYRRLRKPFVTVSAVTTDTSMILKCSARCSTQAAAANMATSARIN